MIDILIKKIKMDQRNTQNTNAYYLIHSLSKHVDVLFHYGFIDIILLCVHCFHNIIL